MLTVLIPVMQERGWFKNWPVWLIVVLLLINTSMYLFAVALVLKIDIPNLFRSLPAIAIASAVLGTLSTILSTLATKIQARSLRAELAAAAQRSKESQPQETGPRIIALAQVHTGATLSYIVEQYGKGDTTLQSERLVKPFIGKRIPLSGRVKNMKDWWPADGVNVYLAVEQDILVSAKFKESWRDRLEIIPPGATITLEGEIHYVGQRYVGLKECELTPPSPPAVP